MVQKPLSLRAVDERFLWKPRVLLSIWVLGGALVSVSAGLVAVASPLSEASLQVTMYASEPSEAKVYFSDGFGNFSESDSQFASTEVGINNLNFPIQESAASSFMQRFDPCECGTALMIERITMETPLYFRDVTASEWILNSSIGSLIPEAGSYFISGDRVDADPQLFFYGDFATFLVEGKRVAFWSVFGATGFFAGFIVYFFWRNHLSRSSSRTGARAPLISSHMVGSSREMSLVFVGFSALVVALSVVMMFAGALQTGATTDEPAHVRHLTTFLSGGSYSSPAYGPVTAMLGHVANVAVGVETWGVPLQTSEAFEVRHLVTAGIGVLGLLSAAVAGWLMFGSLRWGIVSSAFLGVIPLWVGHSMFNMKDVPVATGYTMVTTGLICFFATARPRALRLSLGLSLVLLGSLLAVGTRPGLWPLIALSLAAAAALRFMFYSSAPVLTRVRTFFLLVALTLGAGTVWVMLTDTGRVAWAAAERSLSFPWTGFNLYNGDRVSQRPGLLGLNEVFLSNLPLLTTVLVIFGSLYGLVQLWLTASGRVSPTARQSGFVLVSIQAFAMVPVVLIFDPTLYNGGRQLLLVFPALSLLAALGLFGAFELLPKTGRAFPISAAVLLGSCAVIMSLVTIDQVRLFPYNYSYYNEIAQGSGVSGRWETDYWRASMKEAASDVADKDWAACVMSGNANFNIQTLPEPCETLAPYLGVGANAETTVLRKGQYWVVRTERYLAGYGPISSGNCFLHDAVTRSLRGEEVTMSRIYVCEDY